ncbi:hypothetical protein GCM10007242_16390 [Pigmentiphaga litoralis]|uniref:hypothetical protein n=1 Tax=Pigmentiphaga litoralis TaxID=516702 RepID=UPI001677056D|nr:hypothetical protein [Pigmentiphaga litoralis]GGX11074.1 hypothetical protein GCM10007242_16390 [Pigmentiphaga litoralis]
MKVTIRELAPVVTARAAARSVIKVTTTTPAASGPGVGPTPEQIRAEVDAYMAEHPAPGPTTEQIAAAVTAALLASPPKAGDNATPEQIAGAVQAYLQAHPIKNGDPGKDATNEQVRAQVEAYMTLNPAPGPTGMQIAAAVAAYLAENPPITDDQVNELIQQHFADDIALRESMKGAANGVATLDASGGLVQRMKIAAGSTPGVIRDTQGEGNGKASLYPASIASDGATAILVKTAVWQDWLDYAFRLFGTCKGGVVNLSVYRIVASRDPYVAKWGYMNNGDVPVTVTFGSFADGYSGWAIEGDFGRGQFVVTDAAVVGNGTGDPQVRDWSMMTAANAGLLNSPIQVPRQSLAAP